MNEKNDHNSKDNAKGRRSTRILLWECSNHIKYQLPLLGAAFAPPIAFFVVMESLHFNKHCRNFATS